MVVQFYNPIAGIQALLPTQGVMVVLYSRDSGSSAGTVAVGQQACTSAAESTLSSRGPMCSRGPCLYWACQRSPVTALHLQAMAMVEAVGEMAAKCQGNGKAPSRRSLDRPPSRRSLDRRVSFTVSFQGGRPLLTAARWWRDAGASWLLQGGRCARVAEAPRREAVQPGCS